MVGHMKAGFKPETFEEIYGSVGLEVRAAEGRSRLSKNESRKEGRYQDMYSL